MEDYNYDPFPLDFGYRFNSNFENAKFHWHHALCGYSNVGVYFSISLGLGHKGFHRKLHLTTLLFNLYLGSILRNTNLPLKLCISLGNLYIYMYIETKRCTVLHFDINVVRYFLFTCSGKTSDYNIKF